MGYWIISEISHFLKKIERKAERQLKIPTSKEVLKSFTEKKIQKVLKIN
jgi:hypothetical protein